MAEAPTPSRKQTSGAPQGANGSGAPAKSEGGREAPRKIGKFEIQKKIGAGGMGAVYLALDPELKRHVALKVLPKDKAANPTLVKRFKAEATAAAALRHENIVSIYDRGEADGLHFIALEYVDGTDVANLIDKRGKLPVKRSLDIIKQITRALDHAHSLGIVHRDIKPANLLIRRDGVVKLTDMGLARALDEAADTSITRPGTTVGTVDYMAPEQAVSSRKADARSDIYSLGCTWYHMLTGEPPFPDGAMTNKLAAHAKSAPPDPRQKNAKVPDPIVAILNRMMAKNPDQRYQTPAELLEDLSHPGITPKSLMEAWSEDESPESAESRPSTRSDDAEPVRPGLPPREKRHSSRPEKEDRDYAKVFWTVLAVLFVALAGGAVMVVNNFSKSVDFSNSPPERSLRPGDLLEPEVPTDKPPEQVTFAPNKSNATTAGPTEIDANQIRDRLTSPFQPNSTSAPGVSPTGTAAASSKAVADFLPKWTEDPPADVSGLPTLTVQPGVAGGDAQFATLNAALESVKSPGALIRLVGRGPFALRPVQLDSAGQVVIRPAESTPPEQQPLLVALPGPQPASTLLSLKDTSLELRGVHLAVDELSWKNGPPSTLVQVHGGDLLVVQSSVTVLGKPENAVTAFLVDGAMPASASRAVPGQVRIRLAQTVIRGARLTGLALAAERSEGVLHNSLLVSGSAPAVRFPGPAEPRADSGRILKIATSTLVSEQMAFLFEGNGQRPIRTAVSLIDAVVARSGTSPDSTLVRLDKWDSQSARNSLEKLVGWDLRTSLLTGWAFPVSSTTGFSLATLADWSNLSSRSCRNEKSAWQTQPWPATKLDLQKAELTAFNTSGLSREVRATDGNAPGCPLPTVSVTGLADLDQARPLAGRLPLPPLFSALPVSSGNAILVDPSKEDLGRVLGGKLKDGTEVVVRGSGARTSSPLQIANVWVRIRFEQAPGPPLTLAPRSASIARDGKDDAFITVTNGGVELVGANLISGTDAKALPRWLIQVNNGDLSLRNCRVQGPMVGTTRMKGGVQWVRTGPLTATRPFAGAREGYLTIVDSFLSGSGTLIEADLRQRTLYVRNSVLAARDDLFTLSLAGTDPVIAGAVDLDHCTLSATGTLFNVLPAGLTGPAEKPLELFVDRCVFAPPLRVGSQRPRPTLLVTTPTAMEQAQVSWWERRNGYAPDLALYLRDPASASGTDQKFQTDWVERWGSASVGEPLLGPGGVILQFELPEDRTRLEPAHFVLNKTAKAATWDDGKPIGANIPGMKLPELSKAEKTPERPAKKTTPKKPVPRETF